MLRRLVTTRGLLTVALALTTLHSLDESPARADVVRSPPEECPEGSVGGTSHCGPFCAAELCQSDADCKNGEACETYALCAKPYCGETFATEVTGPCTAGCADGTTCTPLKVCVPPGTGTGGQGGTSTTSATSPAGVGGSSTTGAPPGAGGDAGAMTGVAGQGANGTDLVVTGCSCHLPRSGAARDAAAVVASIAGLVGLALRKRRRRSDPQ